MRGEGSVEADFLNGEIVRLAQRLGVDAPLNAALQRVAEDMAATGDKPGEYTPESWPPPLGIDEAKSKSVWDTDDKQRTTTERCP